MSVYVDKKYINLISSMLQSSSGRRIILQIADARSVGIPARARERHGVTFLSRIITTFTNAITVVLDIASIISYSMFHHLYAKSIQWRDSLRVTIAEIIQSLPSRTYILLLLASLSTTVSRICLSFRQIVRLSSMWLEGKFQKVNGKI